MCYKLALIIAALATRSQCTSAFTPTKLATSVLDQDSGLSLDYKQLRTHPKLGPIWSKSYANKLGRLCQGISTNDSGTNKRIQGMDTFYAIGYKDIPFDRRKVKNQIRTKPASPSVATAYATLVVLAPRRPP
eukprot:CCRYP_017602-RA/>CCRYP_017602-RA protein AED:0.45 eAED:0.42 QI:0/-1/0/1/-1/1/1/0/131